MPENLVATAASGVEAVVRREIQALGYPARITRPGRIAFSGELEAIAQANLWLRTAERVLVQLAEFPATDFGQLFDNVKALDWARWIPPDGQFPVRGRSRGSQLSSVPACQKIVKKAVVERLREQHQVEELPETGPLFPLEIALLDDTATISLDTTGVGLHKRGYRPVVTAAPLRETLAAAIVQLSYWKNGRPLLDPFCGAGTIAIEAAMIGRRLAPGLNRTFASEEWPVFQDDTWQAARRAARGVSLPELEERIVATDANPDTLHIARSAADRAGVAADIHFQQRDFADTLSKRQHGCLITNPPYGERLGQAREIQQLYHTIPLVLRRLPTWSHYLLTSLTRFEETVGQQASRRRKLYNGRIECTLYQYAGPKPPAEGGTRAAESAGNEEPQPAAFGGLRPEAERQAEEFANRLLKRARHLRKWPTKRGITCYRLYDRDIPEVPLAVDRYEDALHIAEYERPHDRTPAEHADWLDHMVKTAAKTLQTPRELVFVKYRERQRGDSQYGKMSDRLAVRLVKEAGLTFRVNLSDYLDTGLFLDHRNTRGIVRDAAAGKRVLNLFCYTGSFTVYALAGGAAAVTSVDLSPKYLDWARDNVRLNKLGDGRATFVEGDSREYVESLPEEPLFDIAVIDPPTFSNTKRGANDWDVQQHTIELLNQAALRMSPSGVIYFSTNSRRFKLDESSIAGLRARDISRQTVPEDFRNKRIHRCWRLENQQGALMQ